MPPPIIQSELLTMIKELQHKTGISDANLIHGVIDYPRWWRVKTQGARLYYEEAIGLFNNLGYQVQAVMPEQKLFLNANNSKG